MKKHTAHSSANKPTPPTPQTPPTNQHQTPTVRPSTKSRPRITSHRTNTSTKPHPRDPSRPASRLVRNAASGTRGTPADPRTTQHSHRREAYSTRAHLSHRKNVPARYCWCDSVVLSAAQGWGRDRFMYECGYVWLGCGTGWVHLRDGVVIPSCSVYIKQRRMGFDCSFDCGRTNQPYILCVCPLLKNSTFASIHVVKYIFRPSILPEARLSLIPTMAKTDAFRICIAILLFVQLTCWTLTLLDLVSPGRPIVLLRASADIIAQVFAKQQPAAVLLYKDFRSRIV